MPAGEHLGGQGTGKDGGRDGMPFRHSGIGRIISQLHSFVPFCTPLLFFPSGLGSGCHLRDRTVFAIAWQQPCPLPSPQGRKAHLSLSHPSSNRPCLKEEKASAWPGGRISLSLSASAFPSPTCLFSLLCCYLCKLCKVE